METAIQYKKENNRVECGICSHRCTLSEGAVGICGVRKNIDGSIKSLVYGKLVARSIDPIEKKPFYHIEPGSKSYSIATVGCNFSCRFCQNSDIAQFPVEHPGMIPGDTATPENIIDDAINNNCSSIAYTYNEPAMFFEFALETARLANAKNVKNVFVTNGYMTDEAVDMISPFLDAANIDLKAFSDDFYKKYCGARLEPVKRTIKKMRAVGIFVEITTLIIPGLNDGRNEIEQMARFISDEVGTETPWHLSRFYPSYRLRNIQQTPVSTLHMARDIGVKYGLKYVYTGNVPGDSSENTYCYKCQSLLIDRTGYRISENRIINYSCPSCGSKIHGVDL